MQAPSELFPRFPRSRHCYRLSEAPAAPQRRETASGARRRLAARAALKKGYGKTSATVPPGEREGSRGFRERQPGGAGPWDQALCATLAVVGMLRAVW